MPPGRIRARRRRRDVRRGWVRQRGAGQLEGSKEDVQHGGAGRRRRGASRRVRLRPRTGEAAGSGARACPCRASTARQAPRDDVIDTKSFYSADINVLIESGRRISPRAIPLFRCHVVSDVRHVLHKPPVGVEVLPAPLFRGGHLDVHDRPHLLLITLGVFDGHVLEV